MLLDKYKGKKNKIEINSIIPSSVLEALKYKIREINSSLPLKGNGNKINL